MRGLSLVVASGDHSSSQCAGLSLSRPLLLRSTGSRRAGSVVVAHGPSCSTACGIFPDQGSNPCPLHWQADSQPLCHQGSPRRFLIRGIRYIYNLSLVCYFYKECICTKAKMCKDRDDLFEPNFLLFSLRRKLFLPKYVRYNGILHLEI